MFHGEWISGSNAGGCGNDRPGLSDRSFLIIFFIGKILENFWKNPQYLVTVSLADDSNHDQRCTMIISLMLKIPHESRLRHGEDRICYRFDVYKVAFERMKIQCALSFFHQALFISSERAFWKRMFETTGAVYRVNSCAVYHLYRPEAWD